MENKKTEKKRIFSKLTVCVAALALVSCAFVGGTFARYTSQGVIDNGGSNIADWYIDVDNGADTGDGSVMLTISPYHEDYDASGDRVNEVNAGGTILTITNRGEVAAAVTLKQTGDIIVDRKSVGNDGLQDEGAFVADTNYEDIHGNKYTWKQVSAQGVTHYYPEFIQRGENVAEADYNALVAAWENTYVYDSSSTAGIITVGDIDVISSPSNATAVTVSEDQGTYTFTLQPGQAVEVTMEPTSWKTDFDNDIEVGGSGTGVWEGDLRDTWIGENIARVGYGFSWTAVQASTAPNADGGSVETPQP
ncbi:MAG: hypothetical protein DBX60_07340 [Bacillota bacterium]|nr:MAG: hypothetical protein DBX60_07340 [Bacillota bacterium]